MEALEFEVAHYAGFHTEGGGHTGIPPPPPQNFKNYDVVITLYLFQFKVLKCSDSEHKCWVVS